MKRLAIPLIALVLLAVTGWLLFGRRPAPAPATTQAPTPAPAAPAPVPAERYPLAPPGGDAEQQPAPLDDSDSGVTAALTSLMGAPVKAQLNGEHLLRRFVATIDNLPRNRLAVELRPLRATSGQFLAIGDDPAAVIDPRNYARYRPVIELLQHTDVKRAAALYRRYYPALQRAYQDLGYPDGHFNDRVVDLIDQLLATPEPAQPIRLVRTKVFWQYADPALEQLSAGQKLLLRIGPDNAAKVKEWLRELRALLTDS